MVVMAIFLVFQTAGQSRKERKKEKIRSVTEMESKTISGKPVTYKVSYEEYDKEGRIITRIEYNPDGSISSKITAVFDSFGNKTAETEFDAAKKKDIRRSFRYNAMNDKTEEKEYNGSGTVTGRTTFTYDQNGNSTGETIFDAAGQVVKKIAYTYNSKKLKTGKKTIQQAPSGVTEKKWEYVYY
jgi:YD repeat-containing protein